MKTGTKGQLYSLKYFTYFCLVHQHSEPKLKELRHYFEDISSCWKDLAVELDLPYKTVKRIDKDNDNIKDKCYDMFSTWLERSPEACWCNIVRALKKCEMLKLAKDIENYFLSTQLAIMQKHLRCKKSAAK